MGMYWETSEQLEDAIQTELNNLASTASGTDEQREATDRLVKLYKLGNPDEHRLEARVDGEAVHITIKKDEG